MLLKLAERVTTEHNVRALAINLGITLDFVDTHISNHRNDINTTMYNILRGWRNSDDDDHTAYVNLHQALKRAGMRRLGEAITCGDPEEFKEGKCLPQFKECITILFPSVDIFMSRNYTSKKCYRITT